MEEQTQLKEI